MNDPTPPYRVDRTTIRSIEPELRERIDSLAAAALEPNPFYESWMLEPALRCLRTPPIELVLVTEAGSGTLTGMFPFAATRYRGLPVRALGSWSHDFLFLHTPFVAAAHAAGTLDALLGWLRSKDAPARIVELQGIRADGPFAAELEAAIARAPALTTCVSRFERALFDVGSASSSGASGKHNKEYRRQERRLAELGRLAYRSLGNGEAVEDWTDRFLDLEAKGWKGQRGTALASEAGSRRFFVEVCRNAGARSRLQMLELVLDDVPIAAKCNFRGAGDAYAFKIAHDEAYAKFSPGVLLELHNMREVAEMRPPVEWMDSCAKKEHFMINRLWTQRRAIGTYAISAGGPLARALVRHTPGLARLRNALRRNSERAREP